jgi:hypothetical protein
MTEHKSSQSDRDSLRATQLESRRLALECVRLRAGLKEALEIAWRRGRDDFRAVDSDTLAELYKLLGGES